MIDGTELTIDVPKMVYFELKGEQKSYTNLKLTSHADTTVIRELTINDCNRIPLEISSNNLTMGAVSVESPSYALLLSSDGVNITLQRDNKLISYSGDAVVCKNPVLISEVVDNAVGILDISGNTYVCGGIAGESYMSVANGEIIYISEDDFEKYIKGIFTVDFDANGGIVSKESITMYYGQSFGELPTPTRENCTFDGWFTEDGTQISEDTIFNYLTDITLRAHWTSDWVLASEVPDGAQIINQKWTYDLTSYTTSSSSSLAGWTKYNTTSSWSDYGSWSPWQDNSVTASDSREVQTQKVVASKQYKTVYHYYYYSKAETNGLTSYMPTTTYGKNRYTVTFDSALPKDSIVDGHQKYKWSNHHGTGKYMYVYADDPYTTKEVVSTTYKTQYRYRDRSLIYTYYYKKTDSLESVSDPTGQSNVTNVQKWVQYRAK